MKKKLKKFFCIYYFLYIWHWFAKKRPEKVALAVLIKTLSTSNTLKKNEMSLLG